MANTGPTSRLLNILRNISCKSLILIFFLIFNIIIISSTQYRDGYTIKKLDILEIREFQGTNMGDIMLMVSLFSQLLLSGLSPNSHSQDLGLTLKSHGPPTSQFCPKLNLIKDKIPWA